MFFNFQKFWGGLEPPLPLPLLRACTEAKKPTLQPSSLQRIAFAVSGKIWLQPYTRPSPAKK